MNTAMWKTSDEIISAMNRVYGHMALAVVTSMVVSWLVSSSPALMQFFFTGAMRWVVIFAPLVAVFAIGAKISNVSYSTAQLMLHGFAALMGLSMATIFVVYASTSIATAFLSAAILFGTMSLYGYVTKKDLTSIGQFMFVGLIAIVIASIVNIFIGNAVMQMVISAIAVIVFLGLTAYDTQRIRQIVSEGGDTRTQEVTGALSLYLNFINLFVALLQLFGNRE
jgi:FtsH-binding integral membrane protein